MTAGEAPLTAPISRAFPAKYPGKCDVPCDHGPVNAGDMIRYYGGKMGHEACMRFRWIFENREAEFDQWLETTGRPGKAADYAHQVYRQDAEAEANSDPQPSAD